MVAPTDIGEKQALKLCGQLLDDSHYDLLLSETGRVYTPEDEPLCQLFKGYLPREFLNRIRPILHRAASQSVASGNRVDAAGAGRGLRRRRDGSLSKMSGVPRLQDMPDEDFIRLKSARDGMVGYNADASRGGQKYPCRLTSWTQRAHPAEWRLMCELAELVGQVFGSSFAGEQWLAQTRKVSASRSDYVIKTSKVLTPFTTITVNRSWRTAAHVDSGDLKQGFGIMCCLGDFEGCDLVFPRYRTAVRYREGDILLADVANQVHGNTPLLNSDGSVPKLGNDPERLVCVFYYQEKIEHCQSPEEEMGIVNTWVRGKSSRSRRMNKSTRIRKKK
jgi:hypothetical protein